MNDEQFAVLIRELRLLRSAVACAGILRNNDADESGASRGPDWDERIKDVHFQLLRLVEEEVEL